MQKLPSYRPANPMYLYTRLDFISVCVNIIPYDTYSDPDFNLYSELHNDLILTEVNLAKFHGRKTIEKTEECWKQDAEGWYRDFDEEGVARSLYAKEEGVPNRITIVPVSVKSTVEDSLFIHEDGSGEVINPKNFCGVRRAYFDGSVLKGCGHVAALCVNDFKKVVYFQDPRGHAIDIPENQPVRDMVGRLFPEYAIHDLRLDQEKEDLHSCGLLVAYSLACLGQGIIPREDVDVQDLREDYVGFLSPHQYANEKTFPVYNCYYS